MKTELAPESEADKLRRWLDEIISPEEQAVSEMTDELFASGDREAAEARFECEESRRRRINETMNFGDIGEEGVDSEDRDGVEGTTAKSVQIGAQRRAKLINFSKLNPDAYQVDVIGKARDDLKKLDLKVTLLRKQRRSDRKQLRKKKILDKLIANENGCTPLVAEALQQLRNQQK